MATDIKYDYAQSETLNINNLLIAGGYPIEHIPDLVCSDFTAEEEDGYARMTVTLPSADHPVAALIGGNVSKRHRFKRATFINPESTPTSLKVRTPMENFQPLEALKAQYRDKISQNLDFTNAIAYVPTTWKYNATLKAGVDSIALKGTRDVEIRTTIDVTNLAPNAKLQLMMFNPYAPVTAATNGREAAEADKVWKQTPQSGRQVFARHYYIGEYDGNTHPEWQSPLLILQNGLEDKASTDPLEQAKLLRMKTELTEAGVTYCTYSGDSTLWRNPAFKANWDNFPGPRAHAAEDPVTPLGVSGMNGFWPRKGLNASEDLEDIAGETMIAFLQTTLPLTINYILWHGVPKSIDVNKNRFAGRAYQPEIAGLPAAWHTQVCTFDSPKSTFAYDMTATGAAFATPEEFQAACMASVREILTRGNYCPTIVLEDAQSAGNNLYAKIKVTAINTHPDGDNRYDYMWRGYSTSEFAWFEFDGVLAGSYTIN